MTRLSLHRLKTKPPPPEDFFLNSVSFHCRSSYEPLVTWSNIYGGDIGPGLLKPARTVSAQCFRNNKEEDVGKLKIIIHHSSLPFKP
jgi:hypothetical protein